VAAGQPRQLAVLGLLATRANRVVSRGELVDAVWGTEPPASAEAGIYTYVAGLRKILEPDRPRTDRQDDGDTSQDGKRTRRAPARTLVSSGGGYLLKLEPGCFDARQFEESLGRARTLRAAGDAGAAANAVDEALALWRGLPFTGVPGPFAEAERQRLGELHTTAAEERADLMLLQGQAAEAVPELTALVAEYPLRERARGLLMLALYRSGRQAEALRVFHEARQLLADELGIDPGIELTRLHDRLLATDPDVVGTGQAVVGTRTAVVGPGPARPVMDPVVGGQAAAIEPAAIAAPCPAQLPPEPAGFTGRTAELDWLHALLKTADETTGATTNAATAAPHADQAACRVVLITGTAGVGKTTLAIRFTRQVAPGFPDGQLYVNLRGFDPANSRSRPAPRWKASSTRSACHRSTCRPPWRRKADCSAPCSTASACCCCSTMRTTQSRFGRCCRAAPAAWWW
jgi:DNA-binding SARP family transcriptional activator